MTAAATTATTLAALMSHPVAATLLALLPGIVLVLLGLALIACLSRANGEAGMDGSDCPSADQLWESDRFFDLIDHDRPPRRPRP